MKLASVVIEREKVLPRAWQGRNFLVPPGETEAMRVSRMGNSLFVRVPAAVAAALTLKAGDDVQVSAIGAKQLGVEREPDVYELLGKLRRLREAQALPEGLHLERLLGLDQSFGAATGTAQSSTPT